MRRLFMAAAAIAAFGAAPAFAQLAAGAPAMRPTSPLGIIGSSTPVGPAGIPLGATEIDPGGLSPAPLGSAGCPGISPSGGTMSTGAMSTFDGGGAGGMAQPSATCSTTASGTMSFGNPSAINGGTSMGGTIPLGATEIGSAGISPLLTVPPPSVTATAIPTLGVPPMPSATATPCGVGSTLPSTAPATSIGSSDAATGIPGLPGLPSDPLSNLGTIASSGC